MDMRLSPVVTLNNAFKSCQEHHMVASRVFVIDSRMHICSGFYRSIQSHIRELSIKNRLFSIVFTCEVFMHG